MGPVDGWTEPDTDAASAMASNGFRITGSFLYGHVLTARPYFGLPDPDTAAASAEAGPVSPTATSAGRRISSPIR